MLVPHNASCLLSAFYLLRCRSLSATMTYTEKLHVMSTMEGLYQQMFDSMVKDMPAITNVETRTEELRAEDGYTLNLYIHRPAGMQTDVPCIYHVHGGGMMIMEASNKMYTRWRSELASRGVVVVGVEFRNAAGVLGPHPFPTGLNDVASGLRWTHENRKNLGISKIVVSGESGGGNLCLALALIVKKERTDSMANAIDGVYAMCPYLMGGFDGVRLQAADTCQSLREWYASLVQTCFHIIIAFSFTICCAATAIFCTLILM